MSLQVLQVAAVLELLPHFCYPPVSDLPMRCVLMRTRAPERSDA